MTTFFSHLKKHPLPSRASLKALITPPLSWYGLILYALIAALGITIYVFILTINNHFLYASPTRGGTLTEGMIGAPRLINPVLATTDTDKSLTALLFAGLMKKSGVDTYIPELAQSYTISPDGLTYTFTLREGLLWSDRKPLVSSDVAFTIKKLADFDLNPATASYWQTVVISTPTPTLIVLTLAQPRADFLAHLTVGIIPEHIWQNISPKDFADAPENLHPVGNGMYSFANLSTKNGIPEKITLKRNTHYALGKTYIDRYHMTFFVNQKALLQALNSGALDMTAAATGETAAELQNKALTVEHISTNRIVALFHKQNDTLFGNTQFTKTINAGIDKNAIIATVLNGYGISEDTPLSTDDTFAKLASLGYNYRDGVLLKNGVGITFSILVENETSTLRTAQLLASELERFGIFATIQAFDHGPFQDRLQSGEYQFVLAQSDDVPATYRPVLPLYSKAYPFITKKSIHLSIPSYLPEPSDRYLEALDWHVRIDKVWKVFLRNNK